MPDTTITNSLSDIAAQIQQIRERIILIYAFNGTGKTRLSMEYKTLTKSIEQQNSGIYYNAYTEDLFHWDNDIANDGIDIRLLVKNSRLSRFHSQITEKDVVNKLAAYSPHYDFEFELGSNPETEGIIAIRFTPKSDYGTLIKISRGEEQIFLFCFFLALAEVDSWTNHQNEYIWIDDPVSSLDENNIFAITSSIIQLLENNFANNSKKLIITTHHVSFFALLTNWLTKGEKANKYNNKKNPQLKLHILNIKNQQYQLDSPNSDVFLYHLFIMQVLEDAINQGNIYKYHYAMLRQLLESISSFLGVGSFSFALQEIGISQEQTPHYAQIINNLSHDNIYREQMSELNPENKRIIIQIFNELKQKYNFKFGARQSKRIISNQF